MSKSEDINQVVEATKASDNKEAAAVYLSTAGQWYWPDGFLG